MKIIGIICEYNPFHNGHKKQFDIIRAEHGSDSAIVCLMSGNYVQRGAPAIYNKMTRAKAALLSGADLVLELPVTASLSSAEGFASKGVKILSPVCDYLCFGTESNDLDAYMQAATLLLSEEYSVLLKEHLTSGISFPAARQKTLEALNCNANILTNPNDILAIEYCKAILQQKAKMQPMPILRDGDYHDTHATIENPSATALRQLIYSGKNIEIFTTEEAAPLFTNAKMHSIQVGERAILARLRTMSETEFESLPYGSEGLWRKLMHATKKYATLDDIINNTKSKRYTHTRIDRMIMCAYLGISQKMLQEEIPYTRILGFNDTGRAILRSTKDECGFVNIGDLQDHPFQQTEARCDNLYGLFSENAIEPPNANSEYRVIYIQ